MAGEVHGSQGGVEGISELLRCYICTEILTDASICPHCSKLGCYACIKRWVANNRADCPHCRSPLSVRDLIRIPLFDDLSHLLDSLRNTQQEAHPSNSAEKERCPMHRQNKVTVYCETCKKCICHECALWGQDHKDHSFKPLEMLYKRHKENITAELCKLKERMKEVMGQVQQVERRMEDVRGYKTKVKRDIHHVLDRMYARLDEQSKSRLQKLGESRHQLKSQIVEIAKISHELEGKMSAGSISCLLTENGEMKQELKEKLKVMYDTRVNVDLVPSTKEFVNEVVPLYDSAVFKIHPFRKLQRERAELYSKPLFACGLKWSLKVYLNGHREDSGKYLGVFVELTKGYDRTTSYQYCVEMLYNGNSRSPHKNYVREYASDFADGESWGYRKFYELSRLEEDNFLKDNTLVLKFSVRALNYHQKCKDLTSYVERLEGEKTAVVQRLEEEKETVVQQLHAARKQLAALKSENRTKSETRDVSSGRNPSHGALRSTLTSSQQERHSHLSLPSHRGNHQHSHSAPHDHQRERQRSDSDDTHKTYISASQQPLCGSSHSHAPPTSKHSYLPYSRHGDSHLRQNDAMAPFTGRRSSNEERDLRQRLRDQRRRSADPAVMCQYEQAVSPSTYRSHAVPPRGLSQSHHELRQSHDKLLQESRHSTETSESDPRSHGRQRVLPAAYNSTLPSDPLIRSNVLNGFEDSGSDDGEEIHPWQIVDNVDILVGLEGDEKHSVRSPSSTATSFNPGPSRMSGPPRMSQEQFDDDEHSDMMSLSTLAEEGPMSSQTMRFDPGYVGPGFEQDGGIPPTFGKHEPLQSHSHGLSQPPALRSKYGKSLTDIPSLTGSTNNLSLTQCLSQSVVEMPRYAHREMYSGHYAEPVGGHAMAVRASQSYSHGRLHRMSSDSHLNSDGPPGLKMSMAAALTNLREEAEHRQKQRLHQNTYWQRKAHPSAQQRPKVPHEKQEHGRHKAHTLERSNPQRPASQHHRTNPTITTTSITPTAPPEGERSPVPEPKPTPPDSSSSSSAKLLSAGGKSRSSSSLSSLNLI